MTLPDLPDIDTDFSESQPDEHLEAIRQEHEPFLTKLEALAVSAIASNDWDAFYTHVVDFQNEYDLHGEATIIGGQGAEDLENHSALPNLPNDRQKIERIN